MSSSLIGLRVVSSVVEARNFASLVDGFLVAIVVFRMFVLCVVVRGLSIQKDLVGHLCLVRCVHLYVVVIRLTWCHVLLDILDFVVM